MFDSGISVLDGAGQELETLFGRIGAVRLATPSGLTSYRSYEGDSYVSWENPESLWVDIYTSVRQNGPFESCCETNGSNATVTADENAKYIKLRATKATHKSDGTYIYEWSDFTDPISLETDTTPLADRSYTTIFKDSTVYYPGSVVNPLLYVSTAYSEALARLKYPEMAYTKSSDLILLFYGDDNSTDLCVSGYIYACNAFGIYKKEHYMVVFRNGNIGNYYVMM